MAVRYLVVVVDGTAAMGPYWNTIVSDYLEKIVRHFSRGQSDGHGQPPQDVAAIEFGLVQYNSHAPSSGCLVQASGWTEDVDRFMDWLLALTFIGGGPNESAIAEGLAEALTMFPKPPKGSETDDDQQQFSGEKHCILVAASKPFLLRRPSYMPVTRNGPFSSGIETELRMVDAETVAHSFAEFSISLSLISPKTLPKLKEIYNAGNKEAEGTASFRDDKNPHFLVLLSNRFPEARAALTHSASNTLRSDVPVVKVECDVPEIKVEFDIPEIKTATLLSPDSLSGAFEFTEEDDMLLRKVLNKPATEHPDHHADGIPTETERTPASLLGSLDQPQKKIRSETETGESSGNQTMPTGRERHHESQLSQIMDQEFETLLATLNGGRSNSRSSMFLPATASVSGSSKNFQRPELQTMKTGGQGHHSNMGKGLPVVTGDLRVLQPFSSIQRPIGLGPPRSQGARIEQEGIRGHRTNLITAFGQLAEALNSGPSVSTTRMPPGLYGRDLAATSNKARQGQEERYVPAWEGTISTAYKDRLVLVSKAKAYRKASSPESLTADWPQTLNIGNLVKKSAFNRLPYHRYADTMMFEVVNYHSLFHLLNKEELCVKFHLASQLVILAPADNNRFIGTVFPLRETSGPERHHLQKKQQQQQ